MTSEDHVREPLKTRVWCLVIVTVVLVMEATALNGPNVCMVKQKYNITKRVKYRAPMSIRTYEWCFSMPPRCSRWSTEMRDLTRLETEERTAEVAVCCPGYKMKDVSCVPICPNGKTGQGCSEDCPDNKWGPNCVNECKKCKNGFCSPITGDCDCLDGWQGESCDASMPATTTATLTLDELLTRTTNIPTSLNTTPRASRSTGHPVTHTIVTFPLAVTIPSTAVAISSTVVASTIKPNTEAPTSPKFSSSATTTTGAPDTLTSRNESQNHHTKTSIAMISSTEPMKTLKAAISTEGYFNTTISIPKTTMFNSTIERVTTEKVIERSNISPAYNGNKAIMKNNTKPEESTTVMINVPINNLKQEVTELYTTSTAPTTNIKIVKETTTMKFETSKKDTTVRIPTTMKFQPKEIWIKPAQKGESPTVETKFKPVHDLPRYRSANNKDFTPATIIVSIIPTSVSYSTFKKIALTTASYLFNNKNRTSMKSYNKLDLGFTKEMTASTAPTTLPSSTTAINTPSSSTTWSIPKEYTSAPSTYKTTTSTSSTTKYTTAIKPSLTATTLLVSNRNNSMVANINNKNNNSTTISVPTDTVRATLKINNNKAVNTTKPSIDGSTTLVKYIQVPSKHVTVSTPNRTTTSITTVKPSPTVNEKVLIKTNPTKVLTKVTTDAPSDDEEFHILTEPEHITAVMGDKSSERSSMDLVSVISIAGGVMMAVITVAVIIVMIERCKKPRYDDVRKVNDVRMQDIIDDSDEPPPYVRSIFHTPLPDPPASDRCHYQPISTLDRNLKQFMRPVVVQTISPIMLENFRGILECHYDHLPRRSNDFGTMHSRCSIAPSIKDSSELHHLRASLTESTIEALKCEAKLDIIDNTTSEPLYAEIPCWRPPSEHAVEILNLNGEAVTEL